MKKISIIALIILGLLVTGCTKTDKAEVQPEAVKSDVTVKGITEEDKAEVREIMHVAFVEKDIDKSLENTFKDLETLKKIKNSLGIDSLEKTKETLISKYKNSPMSENRDFLDRFKPDTIEITEDDDKIIGTIDLTINGEIQTMRQIFIQNENSQWYNMEDLIMLAKELQIELN